jgi:hypothetical protein
LFARDIQDKPKKFAANRQLFMPPNAFILTNTFSLLQIEVVRGAEHSLEVCLSKRTAQLSPKVCPFVL